MAKLADKIFFLAIFLLAISPQKYSCNQYSQNQKIDSLLITAKSYLATNLDSALIFAKNALDESLTEHDDKGSAHSYYYIGLSYALRGNIDSSKIYLDEAIKFSKKIEDKELLLNCYNSLGIGYDIQFDVEKAIEYYNKSFEIAKEIGDTSGIINYYINMGVVNIEVGNFQKDIEYLVKALEIAEKKRDTVSIAKLYNNIGNSYLEMDEFKNAKKYILTAEKIFNKRNNRYGLAMVYHNMARIYIEENKSDSALHCIEKAMIANKKAADRGGYLESALTKAEILEGLGKSDEAIGILQNTLNEESYDDAQINYNGLYYRLASLWYQNGNIPKAKKNIDKLLRTVEEQDTIFWFSKAYSMKAKIAERSGDLSNALKYYKKYKALNDSLLVRNGERKKLHFEKAQELYFKEKEIASLQKDRKIIELQLRAKRQTEIFFAVLVGVLFLFILFGIYYVKKIKSMNEKLKRLNDTKEEMLKIFSHDLKNSLGAIINFSTLLSEQKRFLDEEEIDVAIDEINHSAIASNDLLVNLLNWLLAAHEELSFHPKREQLCKIIDDVVKTSKPLLKNKKLDLIAECDDSIFVIADYNSVRLIIRNLLSNAIKFSREEGKIIVSAKRGQGYAKISVIDSGVGMSEEKIKQILESDVSDSTLGTRKERGTGLGLNLIKKFIRMNKGEFNIKSQLNEGSEFIFTLPLSEDEKEQNLQQPTDNVK